MSKFFDPKLEKLLDQELSTPEVDSLRQAMGNDEFDKQLQLQERIEHSLCKHFNSDAVDEQTHREKLVALGLKEQPSVQIRRLALLALAASLIVAMTIGFNWINHQNSDVLFKQVPLAMLYHDSVDRGFKPYYDCSDPERFAAEFKRRQGVELKLDKTPTGQAMLGISYLGGLSRNTTAVLFKHNQKPIIVFVDRQEFDADYLPIDKHENANVSVHKTNRYGLVFYEVSDLDTPVMTQYFQKIE